MEDTHHLHIEFFTEAEEDKAASVAEGRPIYKDAEFVRIKFVGDKTRVHVAPAHEKFKFVNGEYITYAQDFPRHYEAFKRNQAVAGDGTPIEELTFLTASKRAELKALNIHTAEALALVDGPALTRLGMGGRELKNQAQAYLDKARDGALESKLAAENVALRDEMNRMREEMQSFMAGTDRSNAVEAEAVNGSDFATWPVDDLKAFLADRTGSRPKGNPSKATLVKMAEEVIEAEQEAA